MKNETMRISREQMIAKIINARYSTDEQIALIRQMDSKPDEYRAFYTFAEEVKRKVTAEYEAYEAAEANALENK